MKTFIVTGRVLDGEFGTPVLARDEWKHHASRAAIAAQEAVLRLLSSCHPDHLTVKGRLSFKLELHIQEEP